MNNFKMPHIPDDKVSPLKPDLKWMWISVWILILLTIFSLWFFKLFSHFIISKLDIEDEKKYFWNSFIDKNTKKLDSLNISYKIDLPKYIDLYVIESDEVNAFATIWGNIVFTTSLLKDLKYEEEFMFILWHEMEHIKNRDIIDWFSSQIPFYLTITYLWFDSWFDYSKIANLTTSYISRETELKADMWWINYVKKAWWKSNCILDFFQDKNNIYEKYLFFSLSHPTSVERIKQILKYSEWINNDFSKCKPMQYEINNSIDKK